MGGVRASDATPLKEMVREALDLKMMQHYEGMHSPLVDKVKALEARVADLEKKLDIIRQAGLTLEEFRELV